MKTRLKEVIAILNHKGGVGKTTTAQSLSAAMIRRHKDWRVLVIDLDPQGDLSKLLGWESDGRTVTDALRDVSGLPVYKNEKGICYVPSSRELQGIDPSLLNQMQPLLVLRRCFFQNIDDHTGDGLTTIPESFDYVLIDTPPALSKCTYNAMAVASGLLIPVQMEGLSVTGLGTVLVEMARVQQELNPNLQLRGLLPVMVDARPTIVRSFIDYLKQSYGDNVCKTHIPRSIKVNEAQTQKLDIFQWKQWSPAANAYDELVKELFEEQI